MPTNKEVKTQQKFTQSVDELKDFSKELGVLIKKFKKGDLDKASKTHRKNLEALTKQTNLIISKSATSDDKTKKQMNDHFDGLITLQQQSYDLMKKNNSEDAGFRKDFIKQFGAQADAGSLNRELFKRLTKTIKQVAASVDVVAGSLKQDIKDTTLTALTGPFGKMMEESINVSGIKDFFAKRKENKMAKVETQKDAFGSVQAGVKGVFATGHSQVPSDGLYQLHSDERVVSPDQNKDMTNFLNDYNSGGGNDKNKVHIIGASGGVFDDLIYSQSKTHREDEDTDKTHHKEVLTKFEILNDVINKSDLNLTAQILLGFAIGWKRFMRHPILNTLGFTMGKISALVFKLTGMSALFGGLKKFFFGDAAQKDTDRVVQSNDDIADLIEKGQKQDRKGIFGKMMGSWSDFMRGFSTAKERTDPSINIKKTPTSFMGRAMEHAVEHLAHIRKLLQFGNKYSEEMMETIKEGGGRGGGRGAAGRLTLAGIGGLVGGALATMVKFLGTNLVKIMVRTIGFAIMNPQVIAALAAFIAGFFVGDWVYDAVTDAKERAKHPTYTVEQKKQLYIDQQIEAERLLGRKQIELRSAPIVPTAVNRVVSPQTQADLSKSIDKLSDKVSTITTNVGRNVSKTTERIKERAKAGIEDLSTVIVVGDY